MTADYEALWGETWGGMQDVGPVHRHNRQIIVDLIRPLGVRSILDAGCGNGANLEAIQRQLGITDVTGIDLSENALKIARRRVKGVFKAVNVEHEKLDRTFDLILTSQVIEHVVDDDAFLAKLRAMCERYVIVATLQGSMRKSEAHIGHVRNYTRRGLEAQMRRAGFTIEKVIEWGFPFYSPIYRSLVEHVGGNTRDIKYSRADKFIADILYQLYRLNSSHHGDVLTILGSVDESRARA
jgi:ubiquinone/menaquinone biosynthesis C-methylase UbiE